MDGPDRGMRERGKKLSKPKNRVPLTVYLIIVILILCFLALLIGPARIPATKVFKLIFLPDDSNAASIIWQIRMPRLMLAMLAGIMLAAAGSIIQAFFGNSLINKNGTNAFIILASLLAAAANYIVAFGGQLPPWFFWALGSLLGTTWNKVFIVLPFAIIGLIISIFYSKDLNAILHGEYTAKTLGIDVQRVRAFLILIALILSCATVFSCGIFSLVVGLLIPYFVRLLAGENYKYLIPTSMLTGAALMLILDIFTRIIFPVELPLGVVVAVAGSIFYVFALRRRRFGL